LLGCSVIGVVFVGVGFVLVDGERRDAPNLI
jgi:hypothetical protein